MVVGLQTSFNWFTIGTGAFFNSFFSTVVINLENGKWGSRFPLIMNKLYKGELEPDEVEPALEELAQIKEELKAFPPSDVVWDIEDRSAQPPWGDNIANTITDLSNYFVTSNGYDLFEVITAALNNSRHLNFVLEVESL